MRHNYSAERAPLLQGQLALISTAANVWRNAPQRAAQAIDRLMAHRLVDGAAIVRWAFGSSGLLSLEDQIGNGLAWEAVYNAVNKTLARTQVWILKSVLNSNQRRTNQPCCKGNRNTAIYVHGAQAPCWNIILDLGLTIHLYWSYLSMCLLFY